MAITYEQIQKVNEGMPGIDVKGKNYVQVNSRVTAFRKLFPEGFIITDLISNADGVCVMKARAGYYENGQQVILGTGMAYEKESSSYINKTSYIENCETSAVGRCLGFLALGADDSICSAEELVNAINNQEKKPNDVKPVRKDAPATVKTAATVPQKELTPQAYLNNEIAFMGTLLGIADKQKQKDKFVEMREVLIRGKVIPDIPADKITMEQAKFMTEAMYNNFFTDVNKK